MSEERPPSRLEFQVAHGLLEYLDALKNSDEGKPTRADAMAGLADAMIARLEVRPQVEVVAALLTFPFRGSSSKKPPMTYKD